MGAGLQPPTRAGVEEKARNGSMCAWYRQARETQGFSGPIRYWGRKVGSSHPNGTFEMKRPSCRGETSA